MTLLGGELAWGRAGCAKREKVFAVKNTWVTGVRIECWHQRLTVTHDANACVAMTVNATFV